MKKFTFHIGPHKTATTFLQVSMMRSLNKVQREQYKGFEGSDKNFFYLSATSDSVQEIRKKLHINLFNTPDQSSLSSCADALADVVMECAEEYENILLINENFIGSQIGQIDYGRSLYGLLDNNPLPSFLKYLNASLRSKDIELVVVASTRRQDTFINSTFLNLIADGFTQPFSQYYQSIESINLDWYDFMSALADSARLEVFPFELVIDSQTEFLRHFAEIIGYDHEIKPAEEKRESLSKAGMKIALKINRLMANTPERSKIIKILKSDLPKDKFGKAKFSQKLNEEFYSKYDDSNKKVFEVYIPSNYGYLYDNFYAPISKG